MNFEWSVNKVSTEQTPVPPVKTKICATKILEHQDLVFATDSNNKIIVSNRPLEKGPLSVIEIPTNIRKKLGGIYQVYFPHYVCNDSCSRSLEGFQKILAKFTSPQFKSAKNLIEEKLKILERAAQKSLDSMVVLDEINPSTSKAGSDGKKSTAGKNKKRKVISAPPGNNTGLPASKRTRNDTISSLSSSDEAEIPTVQTSPNKNIQVKSGDKPFCHIYFIIRADSKVNVRKSTIYQVFWLAPVI